MSEGIPLRRRWYQFSLRAMFVAVTLAAALVAWLTVNLHWIRQRHALLTELVPPYAKHAERNPNNEEWIARDPCDPPGWLWLFGESGFKTLGLCITVDESQLGEHEALAEPDLARARALFPEAYVSIELLLLAPPEVDPVAP